MGSEVKVSSSGNWVDDGAIHLDMAYTGGQSNLRQGSAGVGIEMLNLYLDMPRKHPIRYAQYEAQSSEQEMG